MRYNTPCFEEFCDEFGISKKAESSLYFKLRDYGEVKFIDDDLQRYSEIWSASWNAAAKLYNSLK